LPRFQGIFIKSCFLRKFPGIVSQKSIDFRVTIPGKKLISGYCYSEINLFLGNNTRKSIDFRASCSGNGYKKKPNFVNISAITKIISNIFWHVNPGTRSYWFMKKTRGQKSHATVPLTLSLMGGWWILPTNFETIFTQKTF